MYFATSLLLGASCLVALAHAQDNIAFTQVPASVQAGEPTTLEWAGGDDSPVTITLKQGPPENLRTVDIITGDASGSSYTWTPPADLPDGDDYAFQINQGVANINYSGQFSLSGGSGTAPAVSSSPTAASVVSASRTSASQASATSAASVSSLVSSLLSSLAARTSSDVAAATTTTVVVPLNATTTVSLGTGILGTGTGAPISRNNTLSRATLTNTRSVTTTASETSGASETSATSVPAGDSGATNLASPLAFVISAFVAIMYLG